MALHTVQLRRRSSGSDEPAEQAASQAHNACEFTLRGFADVSPCRPAACMQCPTCDSQAPAPMSQCGLGRLVSLCDLYDRLRIWVLLTPLGRYGSSCSDCTCGIYGSGWASSEKQALSSQCRARGACVSCNTVPDIRTGNSSKPSNRHPTGLAAPTTINYPEVCVQTHRQRVSR